MFVAKFYDGVVPAPHPEKGQAEVAELGALIEAKVRRGCQHAVSEETTRA